MDVAGVSSSATLLADAVYADPLKPFSNEEFDAGAAAQKAFAKRRPLCVLKELGIAVRR